MAGALEGVLLGTGIALLVAAVVAVSGSWVLYRRVFRPRASSREAAHGFTPWEFHADYVDAELVTHDGVRFRVWHLRQLGSAQVVVVAHGHRGSRQDVLGVATALWRKGFNVFVPALRGSPGADRAPITMGSREVAELHATIGFARRQIPAARIGLLGYSMGAVACMLAAAGEPSVEALLLDSAFSDLGRLLHDHLRRVALVRGRTVVWLTSQWLRLRAGSTIADASPLRVLGFIEPRPVFFVHGTDDTVVPAYHSRRLYEAYRGAKELWLVPGGEHCAGYFADRELYCERVAGFFARHLQLARRTSVRLLSDDGEPLDLTS